MGFGSGYKTSCRDLTTSRTRKARPVHAMAAGSDLWQTVPAPHPPSSPDHPSPSWLRRILDPGAFAVELWEGGVCAPVLVYACPDSQPLEDHWRYSIVVLGWCSRHHTESSTACEHVISRRSSSATVMPHRAMAGCLHAVITGKGPTSVLALFPFSRSEARFCG